MIAIGYRQSQRDHTLFIKHSPLGCYSILKGKPGKGILFKRNGGLMLEAYIDGNYAGAIVDGRSTSRYCTFLGGNLVIRKSKNRTW